MSLDLSAAIEAAAKASYLAMIAYWGLDEDHWHRWDDDADTFVVTSIRPHWRAEVTPVVTAAAPLIEAQVRAQVVAEIRARIVAEPEWMHVTDWRDGMETAEDIARGVDA